MKRWLPVLVLTVMTMICSGAYAAYEYSSELGTAAGDTVIGSIATTNYYSGVNPVAKVATDSVDSTTVVAIYGLNIDWQSVVPTVGVEPLQTATFSYLVRNVGNTAAGDDIVVVTSDSTVYGDFVVGCSAQQHLAPGATYTYVVTVNALTTATPNSYATVNIQLQVSGHTGGPNTYYIGYNNKRYGGYVDFEQLTRTWLKIAVMQINKTYVVGHSWDSGTDPVPGATVTFNITYSNAGSATANGVTFVDQIPTSNTDFKLASAGNTCTDAGVTVTFNYESISDPGNWGYTPVQSGGTGVDDQLNRIRIQLAPIGPGVSGTINYSVVIE